MRPVTFTLQLLKLIGEVAIDSADLMEAILRAGYGASPGRIERKFSKIKEQRLATSIDAAAKQRYYQLLYKLKAAGLIEETKRAKRKFFALTPKGKGKLLGLKEDFRYSTPTSYATQNNPNWVIVAFDIPERDRKKRDWLRLVLRNLGFRLLQKSVWLGKKKLPEEFLEDINRLKLTNFVEIFEISKTGSLRHLL